MQKPLLSVCITTYNHEAYIARAIESVLSQKTDFPFEIIIGEDNSSDNTRNIAIEYRNRYPEKIRLILNDRKNVIYINGLPTGAWNFLQALSNADGKYIALIDGDDYWTDSSKLQNQVGFLEAHPEYAICGHLVEVVDGNGDLLENSPVVRNSPEIFSMKDVLKGPPVHTSSLVFRNFDMKRNAAYPYLLSLPAGDALITSMLLDQGKGYRFDKIWSAYRLHQGGVWSTKPAYLKYFEAFQIKYVFHKLYPEIFNIYSWANVCSLLSQSFISTITSVVKGMSIAPLARLLDIVAKQNVVPSLEFILFSIIALLFVPLTGSILLIKKIISIALSGYLNICGKR